MNPIKITAKSRELDNDHAHWSLSLAENECATIMCDTIHRRDAPSITVVAELAAIWTAFQQIKGYRWVEIHCSNETATVLKWFNYGQSPTGYEAAYRHLSGHMAKHDVMVNPDSALSEMTRRIMGLNSAMRSRVRRATQLVTMGAVWRQREGYNCSLLVTPKTRITSSEVRLASGSVIAQTRTHPRLRVIRTCKCVSIC